MKINQIMFNKSKVAKIAAGLVVFAMVVSFASTAKAQSAADLQAQIQALLAQIAQLQGNTSTSGHQFNVDLTVGSSGADVTALQQLLVSKGFLTMPAGVAMGTFGPLTKSAVAAWQASVGLPATGFFGPLSRAKANAAVVTPGPTTPGPTTPGTLQGGAGDITVTSRSSGTDSSVLEGASNTKVLGFEAKADGSDVSVTSVRVEFEHTGATGSDRLNRYVDTVSIMKDNKVVGHADASDFTKSSNVYSRNIPVSGAVIKDGVTAKFYVAVSAVSNIDTNDLSTDWTASLGSIRFEDATGAILTNTDAPDAGTAFDQVFTFDDLASGGDVKLTLSEDDASVNNAHTVSISDTSDTNDVELLSFKVKAKGTDITLDTIPFSITSTGAGVTEIANDLRLLQDGQEVGTITLTQDGGATGFASTTVTHASLSVDDLDTDNVVVNEGDTATFTLVADINDIDGAFTNGDSIAASTTVADWTTEDANGDSVTNTSGTASSDGTKFASSGITVDVVSTAHEYRGNVDSTATDDQGVFSVTFDVTAFDDPAFIELSSDRGTTGYSNGTGVSYTIENANTGAATTTGSVGGTVLECVSNCGTVTSGNRVEVSDGETTRFKLTMYFNPTTDDIASFRGQLYSVNYATTDANPTAQETVSPVEDFQTGSELIQS